MATLDTAFLVAALTTLVVAVDPLGLAPIFSGLAGDLPARERRKAALIATALAFVILTTFALIGERLLGALGIEIYAFRIAGGLLLFYVGFEMVFELRQTRRRVAAQQIDVDHALKAREIAAFPLAIPLMAGPGAITAAILLAAQAGSDPVKLGTLVGVIAAVSLMCLVSFVAADTLTRVLGVIGRLVLTRLLGLLLAALAIQFIADGVRGFVSQAAGS
ncbi:MAG: MarC family protein [Hyphomicrobiaceae bacterium]